jgi:hypothetical protein
MIMNNIQIIQCLKKLTSSENKNTKSREPKKKGGYCALRVPINRNSKGREEGGGRKEEGGGRREEGGGRKEEGRERREERGGTEGGGRKEEGRERREEGGGRREEGRERREERGERVSR